MKKVIKNIFMAVLLVIFAIAAYQLYSYLSVNNQAEKSFDRLIKTTVKTDEFYRDYSLRRDSYLKLKKENEDMVGWLRVEGTSVDYPVMQKSDDPEYYLYRDFKKKESRSGTPFLAAGDNIEKPSDNIVIFGHRMKDGTMFGSLAKFEKEDFFKEHDTIWLDTFEEARTYKIFSVFKAQDQGREGNFRYFDYLDFIDEDDFSEFMKGLKEHELYSTGETAEYGDQLITLSTCEYTLDDGRLVIVGKRVEPNSEEDVIIEPVERFDYMVTFNGIIIVLALIMLIAVVVKISRRMKGKRKNA